MALSFYISSMVKECIQLWWRENNNIGIKYYNGSNCDSILTETPCLYLSLEIRKNTIIPLHP